ncbi:hypothetical protein EVAR_81775_1 [Eumeta japonica]|uniref:Uncharacterized protein n=1 Tax=Eumeta variegata TaxID=151549 RepID=A0A4C1UHG3_EUMVA|nr:hypothetical protein EVAR_81775_1 [Eumeta japonica]
MDVASFEKSFLLAAKADADASKGKSPCWRECACAYRTDTFLIYRTTSPGVRRYKLQIRDAPTHKVVYVCLRARAQRRIMLLLYSNKVN